MLESATRDSLIAISVADGNSRPGTRLDRSRGDIFHGSPSFLPDGGRRIELGDDADTGAGSVVTDDVAPGRHVRGVPARDTRPTREDGA